MKVEILKTAIHQGVRYEEGDIRTVDNALGEYFCRGGVAKDTSGAVPTGNPGPTDVVLFVNNTTHSSKVETANG